MRTLLTGLLIAAAAIPVSAASPPREQEISVTAGDSVLAGTLTLPAGEPKAAVVLVQGAGPHDRDQRISGTPMFQELANGLAARGIASVRIDNAGVGKSTGERVQHFKQRVPHIRAVLDMVSARPDLSDLPVGVVAHSEGTFVATELWPQRDSEIDFLVLLGAPGRQGRTVWVDQQSNPSRFPALDDAGLREIRTTFERIADASIAGDRAALARATDHLFATAGLSAEEIAEARPGFIERMASPEMQVFLAHDPAPAFAKITDPVLALWGSHDELVEPAINVPVFLASQNEAGSLTVMVLPNRDHFFLVGEGLEPGEHVKGKMRLADDLLGAIGYWFDEYGPEQRRSD